MAWHTLRPIVEARGGTAEAARLDGLVTQVRQAASPVDAGRLATAILDEVDTLELVFTR